MFGADGLEQLFDKIFEKFLRAVDHMEFHPMLGGERRGTSCGLHRHSAKDREAGMAHQMRYLSPDDMEMLRQGDEMVHKGCLKLNNTMHRAGIFGLAAWILGWGMYKNAHYIMSIRRNMQNLSGQGVLQERQVIELARCLNVACGHVHTSRLVINQLNIQIATLGKTVMAVIGETKFIKFTVAALTDMRVTLAQLSLGLLSLREGVNAICECIGVLSARGVSPLIIPPDSL